MSNAQTLFMREAIVLAGQAAREGDVPVGCVIVRDNTIIGKGYNTREHDQSAIAHAEINAITMACRTLNSWRLDSCTLYVTLEPCLMCAGAIVNAQIPHIVYGARDPRGGANRGVSWLFDAAQKISVTPDVLGEECSALLKDFFDSLR